MKGLVACLVVLLLALQYRLWFGDGSLQEVWRLREEARATRAELVQVMGRNRTLEAEVRDLKSGLAAIEERARTDLGMIDEDETFYRFVRERSASGNAPPPPPPGSGAVDPLLLDGGERAPALHDIDEPSGGGALVQGNGQPVDDGG